MQSIFINRSLKQLPLKLLINKQMFNYLSCKPNTVNNFAKYANQILISTTAFQEWRWVVEPWLDILLRIVSAPL